MGFGNFQYDTYFGGWEIENLPVNKLPQDVASAMSEIENGMMVGASYEPIWYVGKKITKGVNYLFVARQTIIVPNMPKKIVLIEVNVPPIENGVQGAASIEDIIDSYVTGINTEIVKNALSNLLGATFRPVMYIGHQVVKGVNHAFICESKPVVPNAVPSAVMVVINTFQDKIQLVSITNLEDVSSNGEDNGTGLFGYAFTWLKNKASLGAPLGEWP